VDVLAVVVIEVHVVDTVEIEAVEAMAVVIEVHVVDTEVTEVAEVTVATEMAVHVVDTQVVATEDVAKAHVVAIAALVAHADVPKVAADVEISNLFNS
jgi:hypothetical protein